ncbi:hypothetical protein KSS87_014791 [Heliosperma pusillum]|nr:hypothetical protein KSS87_014791 [Heliosperma pusillum]
MCRDDGGLRGGSLFSDDYFPTTSTDVVLSIHDPTLHMRHYRHSSLSLPFFSPPPSYSKLEIDAYISCVWCTISPFCECPSFFHSTFVCIFIKFTINWACMYNVTNKQWRAVACSFSLTCVMYAGSFVLKLFDLRDEGESPCFSLEAIRFFASNIAAWRNLVVAPITEELVFRACMIPLLLCGGFKPETTVFLCPLFFSLGTQLAYTMVFGSYASFLFIRTGHLAAPLVAHIVCNFMGLPVIYSERGLVVSVAAIAGAIAFLWLLVPLTVPTSYNLKIDADCSCWQGYCN